MNGRRFSTSAVALILSALVIQAPTLATSAESIGLTFSQSGFVSHTDHLDGLSSAEPVRPQLPVRLKIPKIRVNAKIQYVGLNSAGSVDVPKGRTDVAWYKLGPRPGQVGSAIIDGHSGRKPGPATVFDNLPKLQKGDVLYVEDRQKNSFAFVVREVKLYSPKARVPEVFSSTDGIHLNLITCIWNSSAKAFTKRLVVFTDIKS